MQSGQSFNRSLGTGSDFEQEFRIRLRDGTTRWIGARGRTEFNAGHKPVFMRGVSFDMHQA